MHSDAAVKAGIKAIAQLYRLGKTPAGKTPSSPLLEGKTPLTQTEHVEKARGLPILRGGEYSDNQRDVRHAPIVRADERIDA